MFQDIRYALRFWARRPWQTGFAIVALAIGIGANTGVFSVVNALLLRSLPFRQPERLAVLHDFIPTHDSTRDSCNHCALIEPEQFGRVGYDGQQ
jgi:hypothetical protein